MYIFVKYTTAAQRPYGLAGRLIFCVSTTDILRSGASRSVLLRSGAGAVCELVRGVDVGQAQQVVGGGAITLAECNQNFMAGRCFVAFPCADGRH